MCLALLRMCQSRRSRTQRWSTSPTLSCRVLPQSVGSAVNEFIGDPWCASWILQWFQNRKGRVFLDGITTDSVELQTGVPQGSVLGPTLVRPRCGLSLRLPVSGGVNPSLLGGSRSEPALPSTRTTSPSGWWAPTGCRRVIRCRCCCIVSRSGVATNT